MEVHSMTQVSIKPSCLTCRTYRGVKGQWVPKSPSRGEAKNKVKQHKSCDVLKNRQVLSNFKMFKTQKNVLFFASNGFKEGIAEETD